MRNFSKFIMMFIISLVLLFSNTQESMAADSSSVTTEVDSVYTVIIPKDIVIMVNEGIGAGNYTVCVTGDINVDTTISIIPNSLFSLYKTSNNIEVVATVTQSKVMWNCADLLMNTVPVGDGVITANDMSED